MISEALICWNKLLVATHLETFFLEAIDGTLGHSFDLRGFKLEKFNSIQKFKFQVFVDKCHSLH